MVNFFLSNTLYLWLQGCRWWSRSYSLQIIGVVSGLSGIIIFPCNAVIRDHREERHRHSGHINPSITWLPRILISRKYRICFYKPRKVPHRIEIPPLCQGAGQAFPTNRIISIAKGNFQYFRQIEITSQDMLHFQKHLSPHTPAGTAFSGICNGFSRV